MSEGRKAYITRLGEQARSTDLVDIFESTDPEFVGTVEEQKAFHDKWIESMRRKS